MGTNLIIVEEAYLKMKYFVENCNTEISGLGKIREKSDSLELYDVEIFEQNVSATHSDLDTKTLAKFLNEKTLTKESVKDYKAWWHSHVNMEVFFSLTDEYTINISREFPYLVSIVMNKLHDIEARLDIYSPLRITIPLKIEIEVKDNKEIEILCKQEIQKKVRIESTIRGKKTYSIPSCLKTLLL